MAVREPGEQPERERGEAWNFAPAGVMVSRHNENSDNVQLQGLEDCLEMRRRAEYFDGGDACYKVSICLPPIKCMAQSVLRCMVLIHNVFISQLLHLQWSDRIKE